MTEFPLDLEVDGPFYLIGIHHSYKFSTYELGYKY